MPEPEKVPQRTQKEKSFWGGMGWIQKGFIIAVIFIIFLFIWTFLTGAINSIFELLFVILIFIALAVAGWVIFKAIGIIFQPEYFSPKHDYFTRLVNLAIDLKPDNVHNVYFRGDKEKKRVKGGRIIGLLGIPYFIGTIQLYEEDCTTTDKIGNKTKHKKGDMVTEYSNLLKKEVPVFAKIEYGREGDTFIIYEKGWFIFTKKHFLRCHRDLHSELNGDVEIYDINPVPYGSLFEYPFKQLQKDPVRIMIQSQMEVILATHEHQYDLISQGVDSAIYFNPYMRFVQKQQAELGTEAG